MIRGLFLTVLCLVLSLPLMAQHDDADDAGVQRSTEWFTPAIYEQNRLYPRANVIPYDDENDIERWDYYQQSSYMPIEGWRIDVTDDFVDRVKEIESQDFSAAKWATIQLPDVRWTKGGRVMLAPAVGRHATLSQKGNATATYYAEFDADKEWEKQVVYLQLQPISACYVWVNRHYVGYTQDGRSLSEFDISHLLQYGKRNSVTLQMVSLSTSNLMESNRDPRHLGFAHEVALLVKPAVNISDYTIRASYKNKQGSFAIDLSLSNRNRDGRYYVEVELWGPHGRQVEKMGRWVAFANRSDMPLTIDRPIPGAEPWSAEQPNLYTAVVRLLDEGMRPVETVGTRFGFRTVDVRDGQLMVNDKAITLHGVVYADYTFDEDGVVDYDLVEHDLKVLKRHNVNAIRTALYSPASPRFYELCDQYGFYVICDANLHPYSTQDKAVATDNDYAELFGARVQNMYERYKNHSSIIAWSLGESSDNGVCMTSAFKQLRMRDRTRPVVFSGAGYSENTDIIGAEHATPDVLQQYASRMQSRPLVMMSYGGSEGNSMGNLDALWSLVEKYPNIQGGFFAIWNDVSIVQRDGKKHVVHGISDASQRLTPGAAQLKHLYRPIDIAVQKFTPDAGEFLITNLTDFLDARDFILDYRIYTSLKPSIIGGEVPSLPTAGATRQFKLMIPKLTLYAGEEMYIRFTLRLRHAMGTLPQGAELYSTQMRIDMLEVQRQSLSFDYRQPLRVTEQRDTDSVASLRSITVSGDFGSASVNFSTGELTSYRFRGREMLRGPMRLNFWRLPTDNDRALTTVARQWGQLRPDQLRREVTDIAYQQPDSNQVAVDMMVRYVANSGKVLMDVRQTMLLLSTGDMVFSTDIMTTDALHSMPRVGMQLRMTNQFDSVRWMGADIESYPDRMGAIRIGSHSAAVDSLYYRYHRPQEAGSRQQTRWMALHSDDVAFYVQMLDTTFAFSVYPYDDIALSRAERYDALRTTNDLTLNIDARMAGIGSALAGIDVPSGTLINDHKIHFATHFCAYDPSEYDPFDFGRVIYPRVSSNVLEMPLIERDRDRFDGPLIITLSSSDSGVVIRYTLDGSEPNINSTIYERPFVIENSTIIKARAFREGETPSFTSQMRCDFAYITSVTYDRKPNTPYNHNASRALFDGYLGEVEDLSQGWIGFSGGDCGATFQLARPLDIEGVSVRFAHNPEAWIFAPREVWVLFSYDGQTFTDSVAMTIAYNPADQQENTPMLHLLENNAERNAVKAVRLVCHGIGRIPDWHRAKGLKPWLMIDEIMVREKIK